MFDFGGPAGAKQAVVEGRRAGEPVAGSRLWRASAYVLLGGFGAVVIAAMLLNLARPTYTADVQILVDPAEFPLMVNDTGGRPPQSESGVSVAESQARVIRSDSVLHRAVERLDLTRDEEFVPPPANHPLAARLRALLSAETPPEPRDPVPIALEALRSRLAVNRADGTFLIDVAVQSQSPDAAARIANAIAAAALAEAADARAAAVQHASESLTGRLPGLRQAVEEAEGKVLQYREANKLVTTSGRPLSEQRLDALNRQHVTATLRTAEAAARLEQAQRMRSGEAGTALPEMLQSPEMQNLRQQYAALSRSTAEVATRLGERHPAMAERLAQQRDLQRLILREKERIIETSQKDYDRAAAGEAAVLRSLERAKAETAGNDRAAIGLRELQREADARRDAYEAVLRRLRETSAAERPNGAGLRVIAPATPPRLRSWPPSPTAVLPVALLVGLVLGGGVALLGARRDRRGARRPPSSPVRGARSFRALDA